jgi:hypothetical protein
MDAVRKEITISPDKAFSSDEYGECAALRGFDETVCRGVENVLQCLQWLSEYDEMGA